MSNPEAYWNIKINKKWTKWSIATFFAMLFVYILAMPIICDYTDRMRASEILVMMTTSKVQVQDIIENTPDGKLPDFSKLENLIQTGRYGKMNTAAGDPVVIEHYQVNQKGQIILMASGLNIFIELTPIIEDGKVKEWQCYGRPMKTVPTMCRTEKI